MEVQQYTRRPGCKLFKFTFELHREDSPAVQMAKMKIAFDRAITNFFDQTKPNNIKCNRDNEVERL